MAHVWVIPKRKIDEMRKLYRLLIGAVLALSGLVAVGNAQAAFPASPGGGAGACTAAPCYEWGVQSSWYRVFSEAVTADIDYQNSPQANSTFTTSLVAAYQVSNGYEARLTHRQTGADHGVVWRSIAVRGRTPDTLIYSCPSGATLSGQSCTCTAPLVENAAHNGCESEVNQCTAKAGQSTIVNWTVGFVRTEKMSDWDLVGEPNKLPATGTTCSAGCTMNIGTPTEAWRSSEPTDQGLYRLSLDIAMQFTGGKCTSSSGDKPVDPEAANPTCPGFVGEFNGKPGCFGTKGSPVNTIKMDPPAAEQGYGNPSAGNKPAAGPGAGSGGVGRTPLTGGGGNSGGSSSAARNPGGTGTIDKPGDGKEQAACGAPGQPKCSIDESGTPTGHGMNQDQMEARVESMADGKKLAILDAWGGDDDLREGRKTHWGIVPEWTRGGECKPWELFVLPAWLNSYSVGVDMCPYKIYIEGAMNFIWITLTIFGVLGMVRETLISKGV